MKQKLWRALAIAILVAGMTSIGFAQAPPASADPGHCWRQGYGPIAATPGWAYELRNRCSRSIRVRVVLQTGHRLDCKVVPAYGGRSYFSAYYSSYFWGESC